MTEQAITWVQRRGQIKHLLYEMCLTGRIDKATFCEQLQDLNKVEPVIRCKDCVCQRSCIHAQYLGDDGFCSKGERKVEE